MRLYCVFNVIFIHIKWYVKGTPLRPGRLTLGKGENFENQYVLVAKPIGASDVWRVERNKIRNIF